MKSGLEKDAVPRLPDHRPNAFLGGKQGVFQFSDGRAESGAMQRLQGVVSQSPVMNQALQLQAIADAAMARKYQAHPARPVQRKENHTGMSDAVKAGFETGYQRDFSNVRIHKDSPLPVQMGAQAMAKGSHIHFAPGAYRPHDAAGSGLLGHELAHVVQ
jgi:hypothetical protein